MENETPIAQNYCFDTVTEFYDHAKGFYIRTYPLSITVNLKETFKGWVLKFPGWVQNISIGCKMFQMGVENIELGGKEIPIPWTCSFDSVIKLWYYTKGFQIRSYPLFITVH